MKKLEKELLDKFELYDELIKVGKKENFSKNFRSFFNYILETLKNTEKLDKLIKTLGTHGYGIENFYHVRFHNCSSYKMLELCFNSSKSYEIPIKL